MIRCSTCQADNRENASFCGTCGAAFSSGAHPVDDQGRICQSCGRVVPAGFNFCDSCGQPLMTQATVTPVPPPVPEARAATVTPPPQPVPAARASWPPRRAAAENPLPESFAAGRYKVMGLIGEGAKKLVYLANDTRLNRDVALGVIKASLGETDLVRIRREATAMARLSDHPNIVPVYDTGEEHGHPFIVSQYMRGGDADSLVRRAVDRRLDMHQAIGIVSQVCDALQYAHSQGVIHRDVKPSNVWLAESGVAKLGDFGLAIVQDQSRITRAGIMIGTATYMSPECAAGGARAADARSDVYSIGVMLFEMIAGRPPFEGDMVQVIYQHRNSAPPALSTLIAVPSALDEFLMALLAKNPADRPQSPLEVREFLDRVPV